ncbi:UDP-2,4-diacetamido-2,4,6-trideoxy-beta-L-altropyranose hydrolase [Pseudidiomarina maritima]|uniref:UDP-2,4-diacetamido-2,4,6-trideoxy-beta-L-altropyranose hydrolase n=1 Tax=Pseudidiomarina maritima TaxID=519453 RepID=A0A1I6GS44_9GAMM|nr:UDP-2,4-diacetamido-2,4,6-trideoxy-beta-L-altropyranose hydrolase [Pseudidiomarina maritima]SFR45034.1 UDP-2,4-diacetamido-2,4,6-trideoxy-beta-L-altropyranose hydrolase [Pseudidiomarina maritima]
MLFVFRADASLVIGSGHIMRCLTLAKFLRERGHDCEFVCRDHIGNLRSLVESEDFFVHLLTTPGYRNEDLHKESNEGVHDWLAVPWDIDAQQTRQSLGNRVVDWLVVDHYALDHRWHRDLRKATNNIMVIDDLANRFLDCDVLLDQNLGRKAIHYEKLVPSNCIRLVGPSYALLRSEFTELREASLARRVSPKIQRILISLGGVDIDNVTADVIDALDFSELPSFVELDIVMGSSAPHVDKIRERIANLRFNTTVSVNVKNMAERMHLADFAIGAAGGSAWERCCLGLPSLVIVLAENQKAGAAALAREEIAIVLSERQSLRNRITPIVNDLMKTDELKRISEVARSITDGNGVRKVTETLMLECFNG